MLSDGCFTLPLSAIRCPEINGSAVYIKSFYTIEYKTEPSGCKKCSYSGPLFLPFQRLRRFTNGLVDLLLLVIRRIGAKSEKQVKKQFLDEIQTVEGKQRLLRQ